MAPRIDSLDHLVLTVRDLQASLDFYVGVLGLREVSFGAGRKALAFGAQKFNLHVAGHEFEPKARHPTPGSADLCLVSRSPLADWVAHLTDHGVAVIEGPVARTGALGAITSIYVRDPDANLIEICNYPPG